MALNTKKKRDIKYFGKDFDSFVDMSINHLKAYYPDTWKDFNQASIGMALVELGGLIGDALAVSIDHAFNEHFLESTVEKKSIEKSGKPVGWKPPGKSISSGMVDLYIEIPASTGSESKRPDMGYAPIVQKGTQFNSKTGVVYELMEDVDFGKVDLDNSDVMRPSQYTNGIPTHFILKSSGSIVGAIAKETSIAIGAYDKYRKIMIPDTDVASIISVYDSNNNRWYEVDYLAQDQIFYIEDNTASDKSVVPYVLKLKLVPRRFVMERDIETNRVYLRFGNGSAVSTNEDYLVPNIGDITLPLYGKDTFTEFQLDPRNFIANDTYGLCPTNTTLTIRYRKGGGVIGNAATGDIRSVGKKNIVFSQTGLIASDVDDVRKSLTAFNSQPIDGGQEVPDIATMKRMIEAAHAAQARLVSREDFIMRILSMPPEIGRVFKVGVTPSNYGQSTSVHVISRDRTGALSPATDTLKNNIKTYLSKFRMYGGIDLLDVDVIDVGIEVKTVVAAKNVAETLELCLEALNDHFDINKWQVGQPIIISDITDILSDIDGVVSIYDVVVKNKAHIMHGRQYSDTAFNVNLNTEDGIVKCAQNAIFYVRYPLFDLIISAKQ